MCEGAEDMFELIYSQFGCLTKKDKLLLSSESGLCLL